MKTARISWKLMCTLLLSMLCLFAFTATTFAQDTEDPRIEIIKTANPTTAAVGDTVTYTYVIANTGDVTLTNVAAVDDVLGTIVISPTTLAPGSMGSGTVTLPDGSTVTYPAIVTATLTMVVGDDPSMLNNIATVIGTSPDGTNVTDTDSFEIGYPGSIGNRIWSIVGSGVVEPREGVVVILTDSDGMTQTTTTDADGYYLFTNLPLGVYTVEVDQSTLPIEKQGLAPAMSSDNGDDSMTTVILSDSRPNSVVEDFAYAKPTAVTLSNAAVSNAIMPLLMSALVIATAGAALVTQRKL